MRGSGLDIELHSSVARAYRQKVFQNLLHSSLLAGPGVAQNIAVGTEHQPGHSARQRCGWRIANCREDHAPAEIPTTTTLSMPRRLRSSSYASACIAVVKLPGKAERSRCLRRPR